MANMRIVYPLLIACLVGWASQSPAYAAEFETKQFDALLDRALADWKVPGAAVVIVDGDKIIYLQGRGVRSIDKPDRVTPDTVFALASCSKAFTSTLIAMLADDRKLDWDDHVQKHLKEFHLSDPNADAEVRLRDLLCHRTGVGGHDLLWFRAPWSQDEQIRRVGKLPLSRPFRTAMQYQTIMFVAAGKAAANAGGASWEDLVRDRIIRPLGMKNTSLTTTDAKKNPDHATPHLKIDGKAKADVWYEIREPNPAGSVNSSVRDLGAWLRMHLNEGMYDGQRLVSAANLKTTHTPHVVTIMEGLLPTLHPLTNQMSYGLAWVIQDYRGELLVSHAGRIDGFRAHLTMMPKRKLGLAILSNLDQTLMNQALSNQLVDLLIGAPAKDWNAHYREIDDAQEAAFKMRAEQIERNRKRGTKPTLPLEKYAGTYEEPAYGTATIKLVDGELWIEWSSFRVKLEHFEDDVFRVLNEDLGRYSLPFKVEGDRVTAMSLVGNVFIRK